MVVADAIPPGPRVPLAKSMLIMSQRNLVSLGDPPALARIAKSVPLRRSTPRTTASRSRQNLFVFMSFLLL
jgi:hypothetical protein